MRTPSRLRVSEGGTRGEGAGKAELGEGQDVERKEEEIAEIRRLGKAVGGSGKGRVV